MSRRRGTGRAAIASVLLVAGLAGGCGSAGDTPVAAADAAADGQAREAQQSLESSARMVRAVSGARSGPPVDLKFELLSHPQVGERADIRIAIIPVSPRIERLQATFHALEGLKIAAGGELARISQPPADVPIPHTVTIVPNRDGIFQVTAVVSVEEPGSSLSRTFFIPVIAGAGLQGTGP